MTESKPIIRYEDNAEQATVTGWVCKTCRKWYGYDDIAKHIASYCCCTERPCECGGRAEKSYAKCTACREKADAARYYARDDRPWDGETPLVTDGDHYFWTLDDLLEHLETDAPSAEQIDELRLLICVPVEPHLFDLNDWLSDSLADDCDPPGHWETVEKCVNDYLIANSPFSWTAGRFRPATASILKAILPA